MTRAERRPSALARPATALVLAAATVWPVAAQEPPPPAMRPVDVRRDALVNVAVVVTPGERLADGVVVMKDGWIERVGARGAVEIPAGTTVHDGAGATVYAGFIDACVRVDSAAAARAAAAEAGAHWNARVTPQVRAADLPALTTDQRKALRDVGFTAAAVRPDAGIFRGSSQVVLLGEDPRAARCVQPDAGTDVAFETSGGRPGAEEDPEAWNRATYPGALIGAVALVRQTFADAAWFATATETWRAHPAGNTPPVQSNALASLAPTARGTQRTWFDATDERMLLRADAVAREFRLDAAMVGSGREYRLLEAVKATGRPVVVPMDFPRTPDVSTPRAIDAMPLRDLAHWALAPTNLATLLRAGVPAAASTVRLKDAGAFAKAARRALDAGTTPDELLAALTVHPARMLGMEAIAGEVRAGRLANLVVVDGSLFGEDAKVRETWIAGLRHEVEPRSKFPMKGTYALREASGAWAVTAGPTSIVVDPDARSISFKGPKRDEAADAKADGGTTPAVDGAAKDATSSDATKDGRGRERGEPTTRADGANFDEARAGFTVEGKPFGADVPLRGTLVATKNGAELVLARPDGTSVRWSIVSTDRTVLRGHQRAPQRNVGTEGLALDRESGARL
ncbi:MAG: amidohydrolase family protein, partial [Phycisphaerales bacterium]